MPHAYIMLRVCICVADASRGKIVKMQSEMADFAPLPPPGELDETYASCLILANLALCNWVKFGPVVFDICKRIDRYTDIYTDTLIVIAINTLHFYGGKVITGIVVTHDHGLAVTTPKTPTRFASRAY